MGKVFALLVGVNSYPEPITKLNGCVNDVYNMEQYLAARVGDSPSMISLIDDQATRAHIIDGFRTHLAQAGPDDVALFMYAGHGSEEPVPASIAGSESSGKLQNLVVVDAGREVDGDLVRPLADKEIGLLLSEVARRGAHVVALMDCCHSGDVTRDISTGATRQWRADNADSSDPAARSLIDFLLSARADEDFLPGALERIADGSGLGSDHVALYACQPTEKAQEDNIGGVERGVFSAALTDVLATAGPTTTYRSLLAGTRARIERTYKKQHPSMYPDTASGPADSPFLDGTIRPTPPTFSLTKGADGWEIDAGEVHGLRSAVGGEAFRLSCTGPDGEFAGDVKIVSSRAGKSTVEPDGWEPEDMSYDAVIISAPQPLATFHFAPEPHAPPTDVAAAIRQRLATCSASGGPSPFVRERSDGAVAGSFDVGIACDIDSSESGAEGSAAVRIIRADGSAAIRTAPTIPFDDIEQAATTVIEHLEHLAKWERHKESRPHQPEIADRVRLRLFPLVTGETTVPVDRSALVPTDEYRVVTNDEGHAPLWVQIESSDDDLHVALLGLSDDLCCKVLMPTQTLTADSPVNIGVGFTMTEGVELRPGARSHEWLRLVVSRTPFDSSDFELDAVIAEPTEEPVTRSSFVIPTGATSDAPAEVDWWSTTIGLVLRFPG